MSEHILLPGNPLSPTGDTGPTGGAPGGHKLGNSAMGRFIRNNLREYGMFISLVAIGLFFEIVTNGTLLRPLNLNNQVRQNSQIFIMALGM